MKTNNRTILMFILVFTGITIFCSQGWAEKSSTINFSSNKMIITCSGKGFLEVVKTEVTFIYEGNELIDLEAEDITNPENTLIAKEIPEPWFKMIGKKELPVGPLKKSGPTAGAGYEERHGRIKTSGPPGGAGCCTLDNLPIVIVGNRVWFLYKK